MTSYRVLWPRFVLDEVIAPRQAPPATASRGFFMPETQQINALAGPSQRFPVYGASERGASLDTQAVNIVDVSGSTR